MNKNKFIYLNNFIFELKCNDFDFINKVIKNIEFSNNLFKRNSEKTIILKWIINHSLSIKYMKQ